MILRASADLDATSEALAFVRFCYERRRVGWPELYDEMCSVASRRLYQGWGPAELAERGIGFRIEEVAILADLVRRVVAEDPERHNVAYRLGTRRVATWRAPDAAGAAGDRAPEAVGASAAVAPGVVP
jgi:hypothetical protein